MEEDMKLYPFKLLPADGAEGESVQVADLGWQDSVVRNGWLAANTLSEIMDMYMDRVVGDAVFASYGRQFPVLVRTIDAMGKRTPLMVCPDDTVAAERYDFLGKAKLWYIRAAGPQASVCTGFARDVEAEEFYSACRHGDAAELLHRVRPQVGDCFFIRPGEVHCAEDVSLVEVAESSPLDFRIFNWGAPCAEDEFDASLNLEAAFDFIDYGAFTPEKGVGENGAPAAAGTLAPGASVLYDGRGFRVVKMPLSSPLHVASSQPDSFAVYSTISGELAVKTDAPDGGVAPTVGPGVPVEAHTKGESVSIHAGESILVPAEVTDFYLVPCVQDTVVLEISAGRPEPVDPLISGTPEGTPPVS